MFKLVFRALHHVKSATSALSTQNLHIIGAHRFSSPSSSALKSSKPSSNHHSFTVDYLINSCGFAPEKALLASNYVKLKSSDKPDLVREFLKDHGFTESQASNFVQKYPLVLLYNPQKTLLPKLEFFYSNGFSKADFAKMLSRAPALTGRNLDKHIIPAFSFFSKLFQSEGKSFTAFRYLGLALYHRTCIESNIETLNKVGVPNRNIIAYMTNIRPVLGAKTGNFSESVEEVKKMGFDPSKKKFVLAVHVLMAASKAKWDRKVEVYKKWGWTEEEILVAFRKNPHFMKSSEDKIRKTMDFFVNTMGWGTSLIARRPHFVSLSLQRRFVPRCAVYQVLLSKGLIKKDVNLMLMLECPEKWFVEKFINCYEKEAPELLKLYKEKLALAEYQGCGSKGPKRIGW